MDNLILYSDTNEKFKYQLVVEGSNIEDTSSRLCLEFANGENMYFKSKIDSEGNCMVDIKALKHFDNVKGLAKIEVITENTFFTLHEMPFEVKKKVNVKIVENVTETEIEIQKPKVSINFTKVTEPEKKEPVKKEEKIVEKQKTEEKLISDIDVEKIETEPIKNFMEFFYKNKKQ